MNPGIKVLLSFVIFLAAVVLTMTAGSAWFDGSATAWVNPDSIGNVLVAAMVCTIYTLSVIEPPCLRN